MSHAAGVGDPPRRRGGAGGHGGAGPGPFARARRHPPRNRCSRWSSSSTRGVVPVVPEKGSVGASGDLAPMAHLALVLIGKGEAFYAGRAHGRRGGAGRRRAAPAAARVGGGARADQRHAGDGGDRRARGARRGAAGADRRHRLLDQPRGAHGHRTWSSTRGSTRSGRTRARSRRRTTCTASRRTAPSCPPTRTAAASRTPTRCAARPRCTAPAADAIAPRAPGGGDRAGFRHRQPADLRRDGGVPPGRQLPRPAAGPRGGLPVHGGRRACRHLGAQDRAPGQPAAERAAGVPGERRRAELRVHDRAVHGRGARVGEQGARPPRVRGLHPHLGQQGGPREHGHHRRAQVPGGHRQRRDRRSPSSCSARARRWTFSRTCDPAKAPGRPTR